MNIYNIELAELQESHLKESDMQKVELLLTSGSNSRFSSKRHDKRRCPTF